MTCIKSVVDVHNRFISKSYTNQNYMMCRKVRVGPHFDPTIMDDNIAKPKISGSDLW